METPLTILYTANLRGELDLLPRLHTFIRQIKAQPVDDTDDVTLCLLQPPAPRRFFLLDLGAACAESAWHCAATGGRSALIVLDAMGYQAAWAGGYLSAKAHEKLTANWLGLHLVTGTQWQEPDSGLRVQRGDSVRMVEGTLHLSPPAQGQVGLVHVGSADGNGRLVITGQGVLDLPASTLPDPTITATVDFVLSEARLHQRRQSN